MEQSLSTISMICFVINSFDETNRQLQTLVDKIVDTYEGSEILVIQDGPPEKPRALKQCTYIESERVKLPMYGGTWTDRYLRLYLQRTKLPFVVKIDPDTKIISKMEDLPDPDRFQIFAAIHARPLPDGKINRMPHGGAILFTRTAAQLLTHSRAFFDQRLFNNKRYLAAQDPMLRDVQTWLSFTVENREDFACGGGRKKTKTTTFFHP